MGFDDDSKGHTAALDLEELEKGIANKQISKWDEKRPEKNQWASKEWDGNQVEWPEEFGEGGIGTGTAVIDLNDIGMQPELGRHRNAEDDAVFDRPKSGRDGFDRSTKPTKTSKDDDNWPTASSGFGGDAGFNSGGGGGFGSGPEHTMALDLNQLAPDEDFDGAPTAGTSRGDQARYEDSRDEQKRKSSKGDFDMNTYGAPVTSPEPPAPAPRPKPSPQGRPIPQGRPTPKRHNPPSGGGGGSEELGPNERTQALDLDAMRKGAGLAPQPAPPPAAAPQELNAAERTMAMDLESLRKGGANIPGPSPTPAPSGMRPLPGGPQNQSSELSPNERTMAMDIPTGVDPAALAAMAGGGGGMGVPADSTTVLDQSVFEQAKQMSQLQQNSGGKLIVFAEGNAPIEFDLRLGVTNIGRDRSNHLVLSDKFASRKHLRVKKTPQGFEMRDNDSNNITLVNGQESRVHMLQRGDEIVVGSTTLRFVDGPITPSDMAQPPPIDPSTLGQPPASASFPEPNDSGGGGKSSLPSPAILILGVLIIGSLLLAAVLLVLFVF